MRLRCSSQRCGRSIRWGRALGQLVLESVAHGRQIAYLRGFHRGMGWYRKGGTSRSQVFVDAWRGPEYPAEGSYQGLFPFQAVAQVVRPQR